VDKRKMYTAELKREAVALLTEHGYGVSEAARNVGLNVNMLRKWKRHLAEQAADAFPGQGRVAADQEERYRLRQENTRLRMERNMLKNCVVAPARHVWVEKLSPGGIVARLGGATVGLLVVLTPLKNLIQGIVWTCEW
jgi:transposase